jgi:hypothetical protein
MIPLDEIDLYSYSTDDLLALHEMISENIAERTRSTLKDVAKFRKFNEGVTTAEQILAQTPKDTH